MMRNFYDRLFTVGAYAAIGVMVFFLVTVIGPVLVRGVGAYLFFGTVEYRRMQLEQFGRGNERVIEAQEAKAVEARAPIYEAMRAFEAELEGMSGARKREMREEYASFKAAIKHLLGPVPGEPVPVLPRGQYGQTRWGNAKEKAHEVLYEETWEYPEGEPSKKVFVCREEIFKGTALASVFPIVRNRLKELFLPRFTFYPQFLTDPSVDIHFFGGIGAEVLGTIYLALGAMFLAIPFGVIAAIYFQEYAKGGMAVGFLRSCVNTLAGVPSVVFGLFGLAFFINTLRVSPGKSVLAGALTLALLVLPTIIRASEEAINAVPKTYKEAALSLGASRWRTIITVILPAALPGILTGIVISMGRAAGETAPIIFTAAVSVGPMMSFFKVLNSPTPALSWNLYNLSTEHEAVNEIRHVQYGMAATLVIIVLLLNLAAILMRARVSRKLKG